MKKIFKKNILKIILIVFFTVNVSFLNPLKTYANAWTEKASMPTARPSHSCILGSDNQIYCIGGFYQNGELEVFSKNEAYNPEADSWSTKTDIPTPRDPILASSNGFIYAIGSRIYDPGIISNEAYNFLTNEWEVKESLPINIEEEVFLSFTAHTYNGKIYVVGLGVIRGEGIDYYSIRVYEYNPVSDSWIERYNEEILKEEGFLFTAATSIGNKIYLIGGFNPFGEEPFLFNDTRIYNIDENSFEQKADMLTAGIYAASASSGPDGKIYVFGGTSEFGVDGWPSPISRVDVYDPQTDTWQEGDPMPTARLFSSAVLAENNKIYVIGGEINPPTNVNEEYSFSFSDETGGQLEDRKKLTQLPETGSNISESFFISLISPSMIIPYLLEKMKIKKKKV